MKIPVLPCLSLDEYFAFLDSYDNVPEKVRMVPNRDLNDIIFRYTISCFVMEPYGASFLQYYWYTIVGDTGWGS